MIDFLIIAIILAVVGGRIAVAVMAAVVIYLCVNSDEKLKAEYALSGKK